MRIAGSFWHQAEIEAMPTLGLVSVHHANGLDELKGEERAGDPAGLLGPWRPFGNLTHPLSASPELAGSRELARGSQSFRGSRGGAAVAGCEEKGWLKPPARELWPRSG